MKKITFIKIWKFKDSKYMYLNKWALFMIKSWPFSSFFSQQSLYNSAIMIQESGEQKMWPEGIRR